MTEKRKKTELSHRINFEAAMKNEAKNSTATDRLID
jgi:hypothetical protein